MIENASVYTTLVLFPLGGSLKWLLLDFNLKIVGLG